MQRRSALALAAFISIASSLGAPAFAAPDPEIALFKVVTVKDEIVIGVTGEQFSRIGSRDAAAVARALKEHGTLDVWRYTVAKGATGDLLNVPLARVGLLPDGLVRIEPFTTPLVVVPPRADAK